MPSALQEAYESMRLPIIAILAIFAITFLTFVLVNPNALQREKPVFSITGNVMLDDSLFDGKLSAEGACAPMDEKVCGADGKTYANLCEAHRAGVEARHRGDCWVEE